MPEVLRRVGGLLGRAVLLELALYRSLARWVVRRPDVPRGSTPIGYAQLVGPVLWLWIFGSAVEVVAVELVLRQVDHTWADAVRVPLLVLGLWGVTWMLGLLASYRVRPHLLTDTELRVRSGARTWVGVPLEVVESTRVVEHETAGILRSVTVEGDLALVDVGNRTNLELRLNGTTVLATSQGQVTVRRIGIWVDEPRVVAGLVRSRLPGR